MKRVSCFVCGEPATTEDALLVIERHAPKGEKGCSIEFRWVPVVGLFGDPITVGSLTCAKEYFEEWVRNHMSADHDKRVEAGLI